MQLRAVTYKRHEFHHRPQTRKGNLLHLVFDIPYFDACGVFPPFHIVNQMFSSGGSEGGMGPGATWKPFSISSDEYVALVDAVLNTAKEEIKPYSRYAMRPPLTIDHSFDHIQHRIEWSAAVCAKYRDSWHARLREAGLLKG